MRTLMTHRERWLALFKGEKPDRIPTDIWATAEVYSKLCNHYKCQTVAELVDIMDIDTWHWVWHTPKKNHHPLNQKADIWGIHYKAIDYGTGFYHEAENHPLEKCETVSDVEAYMWPDPADLDEVLALKNFSNIPSERLICAGHYEPFMLYCNMRGMENAMMDIVAEPALVDTALQYIFDYCYQINRRIWELGQGKVDIMYLAEDLGSQTSLLMSRENINKFILPRQKKMADLAKSYGVHIFYHSDGAIRNVIPDLINVTGIEVLNPLQWRCPGMELAGLVQDFGKDLIFHGGIDNQHTLPYGSAQDVRNEVLESIDIFKDARWVCAPCHNLQSVTPVENIIALYDTIHNHSIT